MSKEEIAALIEKVKRLTKQDRGVDAEIATAIGGYVFEKRGRDRSAWFYPMDGRHGRRQLNGSYDALERYTASIDAVLALVERVLPGSMIALTQMSAQWQASIVEPDPEHPSMAMADYFADAPTAPIAIILALLTALEGQP